MKKRLSIILSAVMVLTSMLVGLVLFPASSDAAEVTYSGTITDQTTQDKVYLNTSGGTVQIKIDSNTEFEKAKFLLPGNTMTANCYIGSDEYWHASKITGNSTSAGKITIDTNNKVSVKGTIAKGTTEELLYLVVSNGTMQIKLDSDTDVDNVHFLIVGKTVTVTCARGSDAYMHALSISENGSSSSSYSSSGSGSTSGTSVSGTVDKGTTSSILFLNTSEGTMQIILDLGTDASACRALIPGQILTVNFYRGEDAWNHASKIVNNSSSAASEVSLDANTKATVTGTISSSTTENTLYLETSGGTMQIKLDAATNFSRCPVLLVDKKVQVVVERGSDEYNHAVQIIAN